MQKKDRFADYLIELPNYLTIFITPIYFLTIGPMLIEISRDTGFSAENLNLIITFFTIGLVVGQLTSIIFNRFLKKYVILTTGYVFQICLLIVLSFAKGLLLFYVLYIILGYVAGVIWIQATNYILESKINNKPRLTTIFLSFYPIGNFTAPFIASGLIKNNLNWRFSYYITAFIALVIILLYFFVKKINRKENIINEKPEKISFRQVFKLKHMNIIFIMGCLLLFFYVIPETIFATWTATFLRKLRFFEIDKASLAVSIFWMAIFAGRMIVSTFAGKIKSNYIMLFLSAMGVISMAFFAFAKLPVFIYISITFAGLGCSGVFTLGFADASTVYEKGRGLLASIIFALVNFGTSITPFITKFISSYSLSWSVGIASIFLFLTFSTIIIKIIYENKFAEVKKEIKNENI